VRDEKRPRRESCETSVRARCRCCVRVIAIVVLATCTDRAPPMIAHRVPARTAAPACRFADVPKVAPEDTATDDGLDWRAVVRVMRASRPAIHACYAGYLAHGPPARDRFELATFRIDRTGRVTRAHVAGIDGELDACVCDVVAALVFPASSGMVWVSYPVRLR
jgi:hypothetical protein